MTLENKDLPKKQREHRVLQALQALEPALAEGVATPGAPGIAPDFILHFPARTLGIEVVEYLRPDLIDGSPIKEQEWLTDVVTGEATSACKRRGMTNVVGIAEFDYSARIRKKDVVRLAEALADFVVPIAAGEVPSLETRGSSHLPAPIESVWAHRRDNVEAPYIGRQWGGGVPEIDGRHLEQEVRKKERKLSIYRGKCPEVWLVIIVDPYHVASMAYVPPGFRLTDSHFDRVVALQGWSYITEIWSRAA